MVCNFINFFERSVLTERFVLNYENNVFKTEKYLKFSFKNGKRN